ncbi:aldose 1-epimerase [Spirochaetia bacterium]|nr:aldose 1-epimerase [Spirochaetia bacterium]
MKINCKKFGVLSSGEKVKLFVLNAGDLRLCISEFGAAWTSLYVPGASGQIDDVILGYSTLGPYTIKGAFFGATMGRYANRIAGSAFNVDGKTFYVGSSEGKNSLHGGLRGFDKRLWHGEAFEEKDGVFVRFRRLSAALEEGYPCAMLASVTYGITKANEVIAEYRAIVDGNCPVNLTNHAYFNLSGDNSGSIMRHEVTIFADTYLEVDAASIPTGRILPVAGTRFDFRKRQAIAQAAGGGEAGGYDHCWVINGEAGTLRPAAAVFDPASGRTLNVSTTQPGVQFYTGNFLGGTSPAMLGKAGALYEKHAGFCLETQNFPNSPNEPDFPNPIFSPTRDYYEKSVFAFSF